MNKLLISFCLILSGGYPLFAGGGWTLQKGELWGELGATYLQYDQLWRGSEPFRQLQRPVSDLGIRLYVEYGVLDNWTVMGQLPFKMVSTSGDPLGSVDFTDTLPKGSMSYLGNYRFGSKYRLVNNSRGVMSAQLWVEANNSDLNQLIGLQTGFDAWSFEPALTFGTSFGRSYLSGQGGIAFRTNEYSEEFLGQLEYGINPLGDWWIMAVADFRISFKNGEKEPCNTLHTGLYVNNQEAISYGLKTIVPVAGDFGLTAGVYGAVFADNLPAALSLNGGIYWNHRFVRKKRSEEAMPDAMPGPEE